MRTRVVGGVALMALMAAGCGTSEPPLTFDRALRTGASCEVLFELRNERAGQNGVNDDRMNEQLREVGCFSATSTRTDK